MSKPKPAYFIAGTDTSVGKTRVTTALLRAMRKTGLKVAGMKPVAAGADRRDGRLFNEDAVLIQSSSGQLTPYEQLNPYCLPDPLSPHIAANRAGISIDPGVIKRNFDAICANHELILVEGAGGWLAPISLAQTMADVAIRLDVPVVLVVGIRLGALNHAQLTYRAIHASGLKFAGWIGSVLQKDFPALPENLALLEHALGAPALAVLPHDDSTADDERHLAAAAKYLAAAAELTR
ncbi:MAG TPA: dethiobiotin synthase [Steroidobacteraceae bacterium]